ncbi:HEAT repeat domain-containing protein [bacterium 1xD42-67]|nr:HEAT repeat domain-containing protein [bacterium 1xD42-67]
MDLQPLYDVKGRLEQAAIAGTGLLAEDFRLSRAAEQLKPLAAASPVFGKIGAGLDQLLSAPAAERSGLLLDLLALADAVVYTQGKTGIEGELVPLPAGNGQYLELSYSQLRPLLEALTTTGGGRMEIVQSAWENHPEHFTDFRVLPAVVNGLGDSYGELAELNAKILKQMGPAPLSLLKEGFDPAGNKSMARRVEVVSALEGAGATPWLREILPQAKKDVRAAVLTALGEDPENVPLLLELVQTERGANREAALQALAGQDGEAVTGFWAAELDKKPVSALFLAKTEKDWAGDLIAAGLRAHLEKLLSHGDRVPEEEQTELSHWCQAVGKKTSPAMLDLWRWADERMELFDGLRNKKGNSIFAGVRLTDTLADCLRHTGPGPLRDHCLKLFDHRPEMTRYLHISFLAALLSLPAAEVFEKYGPYILTEEPTQDAGRKKTLNTVLLRALGDVWWYPQVGQYRVYGGLSTAEPLDIRWIERLTRAVCTDVPRRAGASPFAYYWEDVPEFDRTLMRLVDPENETSRKLLIPYLRRRLEETGQSYTYSRWLFRLGGSPRGLLGKALAKRPNDNRSYAVWQLMYDAWQALGTEESIALLEEVLTEGAFQKQAAPLIQKAIPWTVEQLRAGNDFPSNIDWTKL